MSNNVPVLMLRGADGKFFPVAGITGGGGGGTGGASTAANVSYTNTQLPNVKNVKTALDELVPDSHNHNNKNILDKFAETDGKPTYDGQAIGGSGASTAEKISYTNTVLPDVANVKTALDKVVKEQRGHGTDIEVINNMLGTLHKNSHTHANKSVLDKFAETDGKPTYDGKEIGGSVTAITNAKIDEICGMSINSVDGVRF